MCIYIHIYIVIYIYYVLNPWLSSHNYLIVVIQIVSMFLSNVCEIPLYQH